MLDALLLRLADRARYAIPLGAGSGCSTGSGACSRLDSSTSERGRFIKLVGDILLTDPGREPGGLASDEPLLVDDMPIEDRLEARFRAEWSISDRAVLDERMMLDLDPDLTRFLVTGGDDVDEIESFCDDVDEEPLLTDSLSDFDAERWTFAEDGARLDTPFSPARLVSVDPLLEVVESFRAMDEDVGPVFAGLLSKYAAGRLLLSDRPGDAFGSGSELRCCEDRKPRRDAGGL